MPVVPSVMERQLDNIALNTGERAHKIKHEAWDWENYREEPVQCLDFSRAGDLLVSGSGDSTVKVWQLGSSKAPTEKKTLKTPFGTSKCRQTAGRS